MNVIDDTPPFDRPSARPGYPTQAIGALVLVVLVGLGIGLYRFRHDHSVWTSDSAIYLRMTLQARGASLEAARETANAFMRTTPEARIPESRGFYTDAPPPFYRDQFALFRTRPLVPLLAAVIYPRFGPDSLKIVAVAGYVMAVVLLFFVLLFFVSPWLAALGGIGLATAPGVVDLAALPLTDEVALAAWIACFGGLIGYLRTRSPVWLGALVVAALVLTFARPAVYLPFGAALGALIGAARGTPVRRAALIATFAVAAVGALFACFTFAVHGPGIVTQLRWEYDWQHATHGAFAARGFVTWWIGAFVAALGLELIVDSYRHNALFTIALAVLGLAAARRTIVVPLVLGGVAATIVALLVNPLETQRTVTVPVTPLLIVLAAIALQRLTGTLATARTLRGTVA